MVFKLPRAGRAFIKGLASEGYRGIMAKAQEEADALKTEQEQEFDTELHVLVNEALHRAVPDILQDIERTKKDLDYDEYIQRRNND